MDILNELDQRVKCLNGTHLFWDSCTGDCYTLGQEGWCCKCYMCGVQFEAEEVTDYRLTNLRAEEWATGILSETEKATIHDYVVSVRI